jgi:hypothetical protein
MGRCGPGFEKRHRGGEDATGGEERIPVIECESTTSVSMLRRQSIFDPMVHSKLFERSDGQKNA